MEERGSKIHIIKKRRTQRPNSPTSGVSILFDSPSVNWNRRASKSVSLMASGLVEVWQASARISPSISGISARTAAAILRRSPL